jgi:cation diffusion facilitator family transporter
MSTNGPDPRIATPATAAAGQGPAQRLAVATIAVALAVMGLKFAGYWVSGSIAILSDALESTVNVVTGVIALAAIRIASRPADRRHPFGHDKAEYFSAVLEAALIIVAAVLIFREVMDAIASPRALSPPGRGLALTALAAVLNAGWAVLLIQQGRRHASPALIASGWHIMTDVATSVGVIVGLWLAWTSGWPLLDPLLAGAVGVNILWAGWVIMRGSASSLMDEAVPAGEAQEILAAIRANGRGALQVHDLRTRRAGRVTFIEFHLVVPGAMSVETSHEICDRIEAVLEARFGDARVLIHVEPDGKVESRGATSIPM